MPPSENSEPLRLIVRRVKPTPGSPLALLANYSYHAFITDRKGEMISLEADHRRHAEIENAIKDLKYGVGRNHMPAGSFTANAAVAGDTGDRPQARPLDRRDRLWRRLSRYHSHPAAEDIRPAGTIEQVGASLHPASAVALALGRSDQDRAFPAAGAAAAYLTPAVHRDCGCNHPYLWALSIPAAADRGLDWPTGRHLQRCWAIAAAVAAH